MTNKIFADNDTDLWYWGRPRLRPSAHIKRTPDSGAAEIGPKSISESFVTKTRDKKAALKFLRKLMKRYGSPEEFVTDLLRSYSAAMREVGVVEKHITGKHLNNRAENSHLPFRRRERAMLRFRRMRSLQKFVSVHASVTNHFNLDRSLSRRSISSRTGPPLSPSGVSSAQPEAGARRQL